MRRTAAGLSTSDGRFFSVAASIRLHALRTAASPICTALIAASATNFPSCTYVSPSRPKAVTN